MAKMLSEALDGLKSGDGLVLHSDLGWQYQLAVYQENAHQKV
ncbi:hypothetical protein [Izhakiella capsodis]|nr:hypothetical protein [Izhakiella capsodis]